MVSASEWTQQYKREFGERDFGDARGFNDAPVGRDTVSLTGCACRLCTDAPNHAVSGC